jgi:hypothetical protein
MPAIPFPISGLNERGSFERQTRETTPLARNCRPRDPLLNRIRGGARPGLGKAFAEKLGGGAPVRMLATIRSTTLSSATQILHDEFLGSSLIGWIFAPWAESTGEVLGGKYQTTGSLLLCGAVRDIFTPTIDPSQDYTVRILVSTGGSPKAGIYRVCARLSDTQPSNADCIFAELQYNSTNARTTIALRWGTQAAIFSQDYYETFDSSWFELCICKGQTAKIYWRGQLRCTFSIAAYPAAGTRVGMDLIQALAGVENAIKIEAFEVEYQRAAGGFPAIAAAAAANGQLYVETQSGGMTPIGGTVTLAPDRRLHAVDRLGKLYIADWSDPKAQSKTGTGFISSGKLDDNGVANWTTLGINMQEDMVELSSVSGATDAARNGSYAISAIHADDGLTLLDPKTNATLVGSATSCNYRVLRGPKVYDTSTGLLSLMAPTRLPGNSTDSFVPLGHNQIVMWRDRLCFAGDPDNPHLVYMSRAGEPTNFQRGQSPSDAVQAIIIQGSALAGGIGEPISTIAAWSDDALFLASLGRVWVQIGDPAYGGNLVQRSEAVGALPGRTWAIGPESEIIWLAPDGVYLMGGPDDKPSPVSPTILSTSLSGVDPTTNEISMCYDQIGKGILVSITALLGGVADHYWINLDPFGFWPISLSTQHDPFSSVRYDSTVLARRGILLGCRDGYIRRFDPLADSDDGAPVETEIMIGPMYPGGERDGAITELQIDLAENSAPVNWDILAAKTAESAMISQPLASGTVTTKRNFDRPNAGGSALWLRLRGGLLWGVERIHATFQRLGWPR